MRVIHDLKTLQPFYNDLEKGLKTFEIRYNDRNFRVGEYLCLKEYDIAKGYTGRSLLFKITYIVDDERFVYPGYVCMSIKRMNRR